MLNDLHSIAETPETPQMFVACLEFGSKQSIKNGSKFACGMSKLFGTAQQPEKKKSRSWFTR